MPVNKPVPVSHIILRRGGRKQRLVRMEGTSSFASASFPGHWAHVTREGVNFFGGGNPLICTRELRSDSTVVNTRSAGDILFGCPPEVIKNFEFGQAPHTVVLSADFVKDGHIMNEVEFPAYATFFLQGGRRLRIIGSADQIERTRSILCETLFWPEGVREGGKEGEYFAIKDKTGRPLSLDEIVEFIPVDAGETTKIGEATLAHIRHGQWTVIEDNVVKGTVDTNTFTPSVEPALFAKTPLEPPKFGVTFIGTSSGFDPQNRTTSFILWANGRGIFVDPLADPQTELNRLGIEFSDVPYIFLTHCHGDHDAGILARVLNGQRTKLITSRAVYESFLKKAKALVGSSVDKYLDFIEAKPGETLELEGIRFEISRAIHAIPTVRFVAEYTEKDSDVSIKTKRIAYSADTFFIPDKLRELKDLDAIDDARMKELLSFGKGVDLLIHEAGIPPIHTPAEVLYKHAPVDKDRIILVHTGKVPEDIPLKLASAGETVKIVPSSSSEIDLLEALSINPLLKALPVKTALSILKSAELIEFKESDQIIKQDRPGNHFYIIVNGRTKVKIDGREVAVLGKGDYFGEIALLYGKQRTASIEAISDGKVLQLDKEIFERVLRETPGLDSELRRVPRNREALLRLELFRKLNRNQITALASRTKERTYKRGQTLIRQGQKGEYLFFIIEGEVKVTDEGENMLATRGPGDVFGEISLVNGIPCTATVKVTSKQVRTLVLRKGDFKKLSHDFPGFLFSLQEIAQERLAANEAKSNNASSALLQPEPHPAA